MANTTAKQDILDDMAALEHQRIQHFERMQALNGGKHAFMVCQVCEKFAEDANALLDELRYAERIA